MATEKIIPPIKDTNQYSGYYSVIAWLIVITLFVLAAKTKVGYVFLLFFCIASIIIVLSIGSPTIVNIFKNASSGGDE